MSHGFSSPANCSCSAIVQPFNRVLPRERFAPRVNTLGPGPARQVVLTETTT